MVAFEALVTAAMAIFHEVRKRPVDQHAADESDALSTRAHNAGVKPDRCAERRSGTRHHAAEPRSGLGLDELLGSCDKCRSTNQSNDCAEQKCKQMPLKSTGQEPRQHTHN